MKRILFLFMISTLLSGCYCFVEYSKKNTRNLAGKKHIDCLHALSGGGASTQLNTYYGFPYTQTDEYKKAYVPAAASYEISSVGPIGLRAEKYIAPFKSFPFRILGLGLDYSYAQTSLSYERTMNNNAATYRNDLTFTDHRLMASANLIILAQPRWLGYTTLQGGKFFHNKSRAGNDPEFSFNHSVPEFDYRAGLGLQYYLGKKLALTAEGGYRGGAYVRTGLCFWIGL